MPTLQVPAVLQRAGTSMTASHPWWRALVLCLLLLLSVVMSLLLISAAPQSDEHITPFLQVWMVSFLPYFAACAFVLATKPTTGRWHRIEIGMILLGALVLHAMLLPLLPSLSRDAWRYLWDARVTLHGFSPYVYAPVDTVCGLCLITSSFLIAVFAPFPRSIHLVRRASFPDRLLHRPGSAH
jgi:hypothetical protein